MDWFTWAAVAKISVVLIVAGISWSIGRSL